MTQSLTIRIAYPDDRAALERLATLDARPLPSEPLLVADVDGEPWAAVSLLDGGAVADPFRPSGALVDLLQARRRQLDAAPARRALRRVTAALRFA
ncbi:MAG TPA: hypothetical protein VHR88_06790 [Solirubrobacteraceae bacterium]|jgi:hypothetical protein|nr:hypothetical protein [Solirubrobacteraceae bacterium]